MDERKNANRVVVLENIPKFILLNNTRELFIKIHAHVYVYNVYVYNQFILRFIAVKFLE